MDEHIPVLIGEIIDTLSFFSFTNFIVDATLGHGGYSQNILEKFDNSNVVGLDQDTEAIQIANEKLSSFKGRFIAKHMNFKNIEELMYNDVEAIIFDLGVSTLQITKASRGFSFQKEGPLDMRMDQKDNLDNSITAYEIINTWGRDELADLFYKYGEERFSRQIADGINKYRNKNGMINTTTELVEIIRNVIPKYLQRKFKIHPARKVFQALRVFVNNELTVLNEGLDGALKLCGKKSCIIVVSYQSLEDKLVKAKFKEFEMSGLGYVLTKRVITPSDDEIFNNYRARSAKMRVFIKSEGENAKEERLKWKQHIDQKKNLSILP